MLGTHDVHARAGDAFGGRGGVSRCPGDDPALCTSLAIRHDHVARVKVANRSTEGSALASLPQIYCRKRKVIIIAASWRPNNPPLVANASVGAGIRRYFVLIISGRNGMSNPCVAVPIAEAGRTRRWRAEQALRTPRTNTNGGRLSFCQPGMYGIFAFIEAATQMSPVPRGFSTAGRPNAVAQV